MYLFPVRIQQGWGDVAELANAAWSLHEGGFPLRYLLRRSSPRGREDPRAVPVDPCAPGPVHFPPVQRVDAPAGPGRAVVLATWWGTTARTRDAEGGPLPGTLEEDVERVRRAHGKDRTLIVSLEEFASDQTSRSALDEALRQAGWGSPRRWAQLGSDLGRKEMDLYRHAFALARGAERADVLQLTSTFSPDRTALEEFPFLLAVGPFIAPPSPPRGDPGPRRRGPPATSSAPRRVVWYASPPSSPRFAGDLFGALEGVGEPVELVVRAAEPVLAQLPSAPSPRLRVRAEGPVPEGAWRALWRSADLRIATGSQSLVEAVALGRPLLYFNGIVQGPGETPRGFRREKLLSLLRGLRATGCPTEVTKDLEDFADGRRLSEVVRAALGSRSWREAQGRALRRLPQGLPPWAAHGGQFLRDLVEAFSRTSGDAASFATDLRARYRAALPPRPPAR